MESLIHQLYTAFQQRDASGMIACYHPDIVFKDPAFGRLEREDVHAMWRMLCERATDLEITYDQVEVDESKGTGTARWEARYTFTQTGRPVHNRITASFTFQNGKIIRHTDTFNLHRWARQALGFKGWLIGGTGFFRKKLQLQTRSMLERYKSNQDQ